MVKPVCTIVGVGPGNGASFARYFSKEGYATALLARSTGFTSKLSSELSNSKAYACDVTDTTSINQTFDQIKNDLGDTDLLIYNAGSGSWGNIETIDPKAFELAWRVNTFGLLLSAKAVIPAMKQKKHGDIIVIGATASRRAAIKTAVFAPAKAAQRSLTESMAKYLWPHNIHVGLIIIDGVVDLSTTREHMPDKPDDFYVKPDDVAKTVGLFLQQPKSAWSFEIEARPFGEIW